MTLHQNDADEILPKRRRAVAIIGTRGYPSFYGGFETLVRRLAPYLADEGWDVTVYSRPNAVADASTAHADPRVRSVVTQGLESKSLSTLTFGATSVLNSTIGANRPDVALVMNVANGFWLPLLKMRSIPSVVNVDGIEWERDKWSKTGKAVFKQGARMTARFGDILVADSVNIGDYWRNSFGRGSVFIPYGGDEPANVMDPVDGLQRRRYVLMVARLVPENSVSEFLTAAEDISKQYTVVVVGSSGNGGHYEETLRQLSTRNSNIRWLGHIADDRRLHALWANCGAYFHGHSVGGTNPALVQAMACGAPTVARDSVFNREVLRDSAFFAAPNPGAIISEITKVMDSPLLQESLSRKVTARARSAYTWDAVCRTYHHTLLRAIGAPLSSTASVSGCS